MSIRQLWTILVLAVVSAAPVLAQAPTAGGQLDAVQVTGSRLSRTDVETPAPVQVITREEIARSGAVSLTEVLQKFPANNFGPGTRTTSRAPAARAASRCGGWVSDRPWC